MDTLWVRNTERTLGWFSFLIYSLFCRKKNFDSFPLLPQFSIWWFSTKSDQRKQCLFLFWFPSRLTRFLCAINWFFSVLHKEILTTNKTMVVLSLFSHCAVQWIGTYSFYENELMKCLRIHKINSKIMSLLCQTEKITNFGAVKSITRHPNENFSFIFKLTYGLSQICIPSYKTSFHTNNWSCANCSTDCRTDVK